MSKFRLGETAGIEIEYDNVSIGNFPEELSRYFSFTHDASVETNNVPNLSGIPIHTTKNLKNYFGTTTIGREIISRRDRPLEIKNSFDIINLLTSFLKESGVIARTNRAGIHIHITCSPNFSIFKETFNIGLHLEAPLFYFGCMGYDFRGQRNNCSYCFPLSMPPIVKTGRWYYPTYDIEDIFKAESYSQIIERCGDLRNLGRNRYSPPRYAYLNYYSLLLIGSLEFRIFNLTLSPFAIDLALRLSGHITKEIIKRSFEDEFSKLEHHFITNTSKKDAINVMEDFLIKTKFNDIDSVLLIMESSPEIIINPKSVFSHLMYHPSRGNICPNLYSGTSYKPKKVNPDDVLIPRTQQSHNVRFKTKKFPLKYLLSSKYDIKQKKISKIGYSLGRRLNRPTRITRSWEENMFSSRERYQSAVSNSSDTFGNASSYVQDFISSLEDAEEEPTMDTPETITIYNETDGSEESIPNRYSISPEEIQDFYVNLPEINRILGTSFTFSEAVQRVDRDMLQTILNQIRGE